MNKAKQVRPWIIQQVENSLLTEAKLTPKPGLVDSANNGSHRDMDLALFQLSSSAIAQHIAPCFDVGFSTAQLPTHQILFEIRKVGLVCENAMLQATKNINTHKGAVFAFALLCAAIGRLVAQQKTLTESAICAIVAEFCAGLVERELRVDMIAKTAGERLFVEHGLAGARGEAQSGFITVQNIASPIYRQLSQQGLSEEHSLLLTLLHLMANNNDTNIVSRGGMDGLIFTQHYAQQLLQHPDIVELKLEASKQLLQQFDQALIQRNLSPGGSADLLAVTYFLAHFPQS